MACGWSFGQRGKRLDPLSPISETEREHVEGNLGKGAACSAAQLKDWAPAYPKFGRAGQHKSTDTRWVLIGFLPCAAVHFLRSVFLAVAVACSCSLSQAADTLVITKAGYFLLVTDADGVPSLVKITTVIRLGDAPPIDPTDPTDPPADVLRAAVKAATDAVTDPNKDRTKIALAKLYRTTAGLPVTSSDQLKEATRVIFNALQLPAAWTTWKAATDAAADSFAAGDVDKICAAWVVIAEVLEAM